jgi:predicted nucleic acid-binding Zn ribbon protein
MALMTLEETAPLRAHGVFVFHKCDNCSQPIQSSVSYTVVGKKGEYCTAKCRDLVILGIKADSWIKKTKCYRCHSIKSPGSLYCDRCQEFADPHTVQKVDDDPKCEICAAPVPILRRNSGATTCSKKCGQTATKRKQRARKSKNDFFEGVR